MLRRIADGDVNARELPESVELLARDAAAPTALATVVHIPFGAVRAALTPHRGVEPSGRSRCDCRAIGDLASVAAKIGYTLNDGFDALEPGGGR